MNKLGLIRAIADEGGFDRAATSLIVEAALSRIGMALAEGDEVRLVRFGVFSVTKRKPSPGRNPRTGERLEIASTGMPKFRASKALKAMFR
ncbi:HU family DNA-binding protein [Sphingomonas sp. BIUV-7]|uniref:HU family DNA-binding protein n=1 Tax=Sphingomonas natans TaxID=3063330 RepID=A0ABT8Y7G2_9SPHN|nr:HU family DNA-binding protein [Sphingomonas sp. BIUV-7]MDO6414262.1 HU family DNA-binding protein [Sphingomonas sp. BIUV-7]